MKRVLLDGANHSPARMILKKKIHRKLKKEFQLKLIYPTRKIMIDIFL